jgi:mannitol/fructose-specific phosphotransferase system IIA component (Ntr-type)
MKFKDFVCFKALVGELKATDRDAAIAELVSALENAGKVSVEDAKKITKAVIKRENEASTGMGKGVAIPHVKHAAVEEILATVGHSTPGIDFSALDKKPVYSVILLLSPVNDPDKHLRAMEKIFKHLQNERFRKFLRQSDTPDKIEDLLREVDENPSLE